MRPCPSPSPSSALAREALSQAAALPISNPWRGTWSRVERDPEAWCGLVG